MPIGRRTLLLSCAALLARPAGGGAPPVTIHVVKDPGCGCCADWADYLREQGFAVTGEERDAASLARFKRDRGVPAAAQSCHTAVVEGYVLEGHVPAADIRRLLAERPAAIGLAVPGMPWGAPGMGPESEREGYDVLLIGRDGGTGVFSRHPAV